MIVPFTVCGSVTVPSITREVVSQVTAICLDPSTVTTSTVSGRPIAAISCGKTLIIFSASTISLIKVVYTAVNSTSPLTEVKSKVSLGWYKASPNFQPANSLPSGAVGAAPTVKLVTVNSIVSSSGAFVPLNASYETFLTEGETLREKESGFISPPYVNKTT